MVPKRWELPWQLRRRLPCGKKRRKGNIQGSLSKDSQEFQSSEIRSLSKIPNIFLDAWAFSDPSLSCEHNFHKSNRIQKFNSHKRIHMLKENRFDWWIVEWCFQHLKALASNWSKASSFGRAECKRIHGLRVWSWKPLVQVLNPWRDPLVLGKCRKCLFCLQTPGQRSPFCQHLPLQFIHSP